MIKCALPPFQGRQYAIKLSACRRRAQSADSYGSAVGQPLSLHSVTCLHSICGYSIRCISRWTVRSDSKSLTELFWSARSLGSEKIWRSSSGRSLACNASYYVTRHLWGLSWWQDLRLSSPAPNPFDEQSDNKIHTMPNRKWPPVRWPGNSSHWPWCFNFFFFANHFPIAYRGGRSMIVLFENALFETWKLKNSRTLIRMVWSSVISGRLAVDCWAFQSAFQCLIDDLNWG